MMVKICGITNPEDALAAVASGAAALGFNFYEASPRFLTLDAARRIIEKLPAGVWKVGVFVNEEPERIAEVAREAGLDVAQLHGGTAPKGMRAWRAFRVTQDFDAAALALAGAEAALLDTPSETLHGGTGKCFDWSRARAASARIILAGGLDASNVREAIRLARPWGVDACSRLELAPGRKHHARMAAFIQAALAEEA